MLWIHPVIALVLAVLFAVILVNMFGWRHPRRTAPGASLVFLLIFLFPVLWAVAVWSAPVGPTVLGAHVVPVVLMGLLLALMIGVLVSPRPAAPEAAAEAEADAAATAFGIVFWILLLVATGMIVGGSLL